MIARLCIFIVTRIILYDTIYRPRTVRGGRMRTDPLCILQVTQKTRKIEKQTDAGEKRVIRTHRSYYMLYLIFVSELHVRTAIIVITASPSSVSIPTAAIYYNNNIIYRAKDFSTARSPRRSLFA